MNMQNSSKLFKIHVVFSSFCSDRKCVYRSKGGQEFWHHTQELGEMKLCRTLLWIYAETNPLVFCRFSLQAIRNHFSRLDPHLEFPFLSVGFVQASVGYLQTVLNVQPTTRLFRRSRPFSFVKCNDAGPISDYGQLMSAHVNLATLEK